MDNSKHNFGTKMYDLANNIAATALCTVVSGVIAILYTRFGPTWAKPLMNGVIAGAVTLAIFLSLRAILSLPRAKAAITPENVGGFVLSSLHKFNLEVKNIVDDESYFIFKVTTDAGKVVTVRRARKLYSDYLTFRAVITLSDDEKKEFASFTEYERASLAQAIQIEIARAVMGYRTDGLLSHDLWLWRHIPISATLSEETVITTIWQMEAMVTTLFSTGALAIVKHRENAHPKLHEAMDQTAISGTPGNTGEIKQDSGQPVSLIQDRERGLDDLNRG